MSVPLRTFAVLQDQLDAGADVEPAMRALFDAASEEGPHEDWRRLRELPYRSGASFIREWLDRVMAEEPPPRAADGLWFGLFTPFYEDGEARADAYVHGCKFDPIDGDWACTALWKPRGAYARSNLLRDVHRVAYSAPEGLGVDAEYPAVLGFVALSVAAWARGAAANGASIARDRRQLVVGFDSGDRVHVGELEERTFRRPREKFPSVS
ncbi:MAG TPA: hypothetical protein VGI39_35005 [Polyangiaceae bacterium]|jgi:hypothetical protein